MRQHLVQEVSLDYTNYQSQQKGGKRVANNEAAGGVKNNRDLSGWAMLRAKSSSHASRRAKTSQVKFCIPRSTEEIIEGVKTPEVSSIAD